MSIAIEHINRARDLLVEAGATRVLVFGSASDCPEKARDLDLACSGIPPGDFFAVYGRLLSEMPVMVDLIDLDERTAFSRRIEEKGRVLHESGHPPARP